MKISFVTNDYPVIQEDNPPDYTPLHSKSLRYTLDG